MRKGGITALFLRLRLAYSCRTKNSGKQALYSCTQVMSISTFLHTGYFDADILARRPYFDVDPRPPLRLAVALSSNVMPKGRKIP